MMDWKQLLNTDRESEAHKVADIRNAFQRDYDRIIFSNVFRRMQNKTQVFPLPGSQMVHNRLTHSLEVASVGRSIARKVSTEIAKRNPSLSGLIDDIDTIVSAACLAHDLGNPPFGHSGEETISSFFKDGDGQSFKVQIPENQWSDFISFEGNANAFRQLTHTFQGRRIGGMSLTYSTLATLIKYPYPSFGNEKRKKYNVFFSEIETFRKVMDKCGIPCLDEKKIIYARHPLSYMMEASDDICYLVLDMEDAHKRSIITTESIEGHFTAFFNAEDENDAWFFGRKEDVYNTVTDKNERMAFLRAMVINKLVNCAAHIFIDNYGDIMSGSFSGSLISHLPDFEKKALEDCRDFSSENIYRNPAVVKIELTGFNVIGELMSEFVSAAANPDTTYKKKLFSLIPEQFRTDKSDVYSKVQVALDFISNMTDLYAVQLYKDIRGIDN